MRWLRSDMLYSPVGVLSPRGGSAQLYGASQLSAIPEGLFNTEVLLGGFTLNPALYAGSASYLTFVGTIVHAGGTSPSVDLRIYDMGAPGTPQAGDLRASVICTTVNTPRRERLVLSPSSSPTTPGSGPDDGTIYNTERIYEVRMYVTGPAPTYGNSVSIAWAGVQRGI